MHSTKEKVLLTLIVTSLILFICTFWLTSNTITNVSAVEANGVGVYWDSKCTNRVLSIGWGTLTPRSVKRVVVYIRNAIEEPIYLTLETTNWNPSKASLYLNLEWNYSGQWMNLGETRQITLTLSVSRYIEGISSFYFDILIIGSNSLLGDFDGDRDVDVFDVARVAKAYGSAAVDDPKTPWNETTLWDPVVDVYPEGGDLKIDTFDVATVAKHYGGGMG